MAGKISSKRRAVNSQIGRISKNEKGRSGYENENAIRKMVGKQMGKISGGQLVRNERRNSSFTRSSRKLNPISGRGTSNKRHRFLSIRK